MGLCLKKKMLVIAFCRKIFVEVTRVSLVDLCALRGEKKRVKYNPQRYKLEKNHVNCKKPKPKPKPKNEFMPYSWRNRPFTCQQKIPGNTVKLQMISTKKACSNHARETEPAKTLKSERPENLRINTPNNTKAIALLQQQKVNSANDSLYSSRPRPTKTYPSWPAVEQASSFFPSN